MILTVTPNTAIDRTFFIAEFSLGRTIRALRAALGMGGKGADAAWILGELGHDVVAIGFASGLTGFQMEEMLREKGVQTDFVWVRGETRLNTVIVSQDVGEQSTISAPSLVVEESFQAVLYDLYLQWLPECASVIIGGSLPEGICPEFYGRYIRAARDQGIPVIFDSSGPPLRAGLERKPSFVKPNRGELAELCGESLVSLEQVYAGACTLQERYETIPIVTLGDEGALAVLPDRAYRIPPPGVEVVSSAGAGDAVLAGLAASMDRGSQLEDGLRLGFAAAAAVMLTPGTADCRAPDVERLIPKIELVPYPGEAISS